MGRSYVSQGDFIIGCQISLVIAMILRYRTRVSVPWFLIAFAASALSCIAAGICPSFKAIQIHPVDITRS